MLRGPVVDAGVEDAVTVGRYRYRTKVDVGEVTLALALKHGLNVVLGHDGHDEVQVLAEEFPDLGSFETPGQPVRVPHVLVLENEALRLRSRDDLGLELAVRDGVGHEVRRSLGSDHETVELQWDRGLCPYSEVLCPRGLHAKGDPREFELPVSFEPHLGGCDPLDRKDR